MNIKTKNTEKISEFTTSATETKTQEHGDARFAVKKITHKMFGIPQTITISSMIICLAIIGQKDSFGAFFIRVFIILPAIMAICGISQ